MSESYQSLLIYLNRTNHWMIQTYHQSLVWFRHIISHWYDSDILSVIGMIQTYYQSLVWFRHIISHCYDSDIISVIGDSMSVSCQWLILCLNHTSDWYYVWSIPMTDNMSESYQWLIICPDILSVIGMIQVYYQSLVWIRYIFNHWYDSDILSVIGMIQTYYQSLVWFRNWWYNWIMPMTDNIPESYQWLILCLNHNNDW
jgi:hypothetical protein